MLVDDLHPVLCAWCGVSVGYSSITGSHGICRGCFEQLLGIPLLSEVELSELPIGLIELAPDGTVLTYNAAEQALSGKEASAVIGRNFFTEVAPCTGVREFQGRFADFLSTSADPTSFLFTFPFPLRSIDVSIAFVRSEHDTAYVLVKADAAAPAVHGR